MNLQLEKSGPFSFVHEDRGKFKYENGRGQYFNISKRNVACTDYRSVAVAAFLVRNLKKYKSCIYVTQKEAAENSLCMQTVWRKVLLVQV